MWISLIPLVLGASAIDVAGDDVYSFVYVWDEDCYHHLVKNVIETVVLGADVPFELLEW